MSLSALDDLAAEPTPDQVAAVLGPALAAWQALAAWLGREAAVDAFTWASSGRTYGWSLRARSGKRNIAYLIPQRGSFLVGLVLGDRALAAARSVSLSAGATATIAAARRYAEGTGFRLPVASLADLDDVETLVRAKVGR